MATVKITNQTKRRLELWCTAKDDSRMITLGLEPHSTVGLDATEMVKIPVSLFARNEADFHIQIIKDYGEEHANKEGE